MKHRTVADVMTREVVTVHRHTPFKSIAMVLADAEVAAVPVVDPHNRPIGIVSEADLLRKESAQPEPGGRGEGLWMRPRDRERAAAETAEQLMSTTLFSARPDWSLVEAARMMDRHHVKRLPVIDDAGMLVGIVSRSDVIGVFLRPDEAIRREIVDDVLREILMLPEKAVSVEVREGVVTLRGEVERQSLMILAVKLCRTVDGVVAVHDQLRFTFDDRLVDLGPQQPHGVLHHPSRH
jgi:CBS-domain-containing membrane protein